MGFRTGAAFRRVGHFDTAQDNTMTNKKTLLLLGSILALPAPTASLLAAKLDGAHYLKDARITLVEARAIALKTQGGAIVSEELEKEAGGSGLRYSFDIKKGGVTHEIGVDASSGKVLENSVEGRNAD
jgi:uncharacterized membrane protein YkoI